MIYQNALKAMKEGRKVRLPEFRGYWFLGENNEVLALTKDGEVKKAWVADYITREDFEIANGCDFGWALTAMKAGKLVARKGWNGKGMFVFIRPADNLTIETIVHKVKSLPNEVKWHFANQTNPEINNGIDGESEIRFTAYFCMKNAQGDIMNGWIPTQTDCLVEDWELFQE